MSKGEEYPELVYRGSSKLIKLCILFSIVLILLGTFSLSMGTAKVSLLKTLSLIWSPLVGLEAPFSQMEKTIIFQIRLPRIILTAIVGIALSVAGVVFQALLRNPLAEPFILGISSGAAVGALLATGIGLSIFPVGTSISAFLGAAFSMILVFSIAGVRGRLISNTILLTGVIINAFFTAVIMTILSIVPEERIHRMLFWLYGDLSTVKYMEVITISPFVIAGCIFIYTKARDMNAIVTGEDVATQLGIDVEGTKRFLYFFSSLITGVVVSASGIIGFVGLIVPHLVRMMIGSDHRFLIPLSSLFGASFLIIADTLARTIISPGELPVGVITAGIGAPFFIYLLKKRGSQWNQS
jgi:iron complex transport system permease protein